MKYKITITITLLSILFLALFAPIPQAPKATSLLAMKRESRITYEAPEARIVQINLPGGYVRFLEV